MITVLLVAAVQVAYYMQAPSATAYTIPDTGHDLTLHPPTEVSFGSISQWLENVR